MPAPQIDLAEIANGLARLNSARESTARAAALEAQRQADGVSAAQAAQQVAAVRAEFTRLSSLQQNLKAEIDTKRATYAALSRELPALGDRFSAVLSELGRMQARYDFLKG